MPSVGHVRVSTARGAAPLRSVVRQFRHQHWLVHYDQDLAGSKTWRGGVRTKFFHNGKMNQQKTLNEVCSDPAFDDPAFDPFYPMDGLYSRAGEE